jgi:hypothetical protein
MSTQHTLVEDGQDPVVDFELIDSRSPYELRMAGDITELDFILRQHEMLNRAKQEQYQLEQFIKQLNIEMGEVLAYSGQEKFVIPGQGSYGISKSSVRVTYNSKDTDRLVELFKGSDDPAYNRAAEMICKYRKETEIPGSLRFTPARNTTVSGDKKKSEVPDELDW